MHIKALIHSSHSPQVKEAYRRLAKRHHPDKNPDVDAAAIFSEISDAYEILIDDKERAMYDALGPERYGDPSEQFRYELQREIAEREALTPLQGTTGHRSATMTPSSRYS